MTKNYKYEKITIDPGMMHGVLDEWNTAHRDSFFDIDTTRETMSAALSRTRAYHLRLPHIDPAKIKNTQSTQHIIECRDTPLLSVFPKMHNFINEVGQNLYGGWTILGRIFITRLDASKNIDRHVDVGNYFDTLHRFHVPLKSEGALFKWDDDEVFLNVGDLWKLNNSIPHWIENGPVQRTHLIFDGV